jgi:hypothetical protein
VVLAGQAHYSPKEMGTHGFVLSHFEYSDKEKLNTAHPFTIFWRLLNWLYALWDF